MYGFFFFKWKLLLSLKKSSEFEKTVTAKEPKKKSVKPAATPIFTRKEVAMLAQWIEILNWHNKNGKKKKNNLRLLVIL